MPTVMVAEPTSLPVTTPFESTDTSELRLDLYFSSLTEPSGYKVATSWIFSFSPMVVRSAVREMLWGSNGIAVAEAEGEAIIDIDAFTS